MLQAPISISASLLLTASIALTCALPVTADDTAPGTAKETPAQGVPRLPMMTRTKAPGAPEAPKAPDVIDAKAKAIHDRGVETVKKLKGIEMVAEMKVQGIDPAMLPPGLDGKSHVVLDFKNDSGGPAPFGRFVLESMKDGKTQMRFAFDGKGAVMIDEAKKCYTVSDAQWFQLLGQRAAALPQWYIENRMDMAAMGGSPDDQPKLVAATIVGEETLDGTPCDVIKVVRSMKLEGGEDDEGKPVPAKEMRISETIAFARTDGLPRRVASATEIPGEEAMSGMNTTATFNGVKADPTLDDKTFATAAPAGYKKQEAAAEDEQSQGPQMKVKAGEAALDFKLMDLAGKEVTLASLKGKVVLLDFWATWCGPCKQAMPSIQKISEDYKGKDVVILGVNTWEKKEGAGKKYMTEKGFTYGCLLAGDDLAVAYGISGIPTLIVIGKDGKIEKIEVGFGPEGDKGLRTAIEAGLAK
ncbi:MAG: TlpA disulfide reductase family protein [Planctomycetota bacterium]|nr:TlpA disulfide reductase family protein [Planctomycetota bacterium]